MQIANLAEVKDQLSRYVELVRRGERVRILVRGVPVADLVPITEAAPDEDFDATELRRLERAGVIRRGDSRGWPAELDRPGPRVPGNAAVETVLAERRRGR